MIRLFKGFYMSLGMFCAIPLPVNLWDDDCMSLMLPSMPIVGAVIGLIWWGAAEALAALGINTMLSAAIIAVLPFLLTGFLHLDGYMDTSDAVLSRRPLEEKLRILKDPHMGAFAAIMICMLFTLQFATGHAVFTNRQNFIVLLLIPIISRCCSAMSIFLLEPMPQSGYAKMFRQNVSAAHKVAVCVIAVIALALGMFFAGWRGTVALVVCVIGFAGGMAYSFKEFSGISGDLTGFSLVIGELFGLLALSVI